MRLTSDDLRAGRIDDDRLAHLVDAYRDTGIAVLEHAVPLDLVAQMREAVHRSREANGHYCPKWDPSCTAPFVGCSFFEWEAPFNDPRFVAHPILMQLADAVLGDFVCRIYNTNLSSPDGTTNQPIHVDVPSLLEDGTLRTTPLMSVQLNLCDFTEENGSTQLWPATHRTPAPKGWADELTARAAEYPSVRANFPAGTIWVRHPSVWHRGMANRTGQWREMLSIFFAPRQAPFDTQYFERELRITREQLEALPERAQRVWGVNLAEPAAAR